METTLEQQKVGARLLEARKNAGLTQVEVADALGIPQQTVAYWERHARSLRADVLPRLAELYGVSLDSLLGSNERMKKPGPSSRLDLLIGELASQPRRKQERILDVVETMLKS